MRKQERKRGELERPRDLHLDYRGWRFFPPFICMSCGVVVSTKQWAFSRSCGPCDLSESKTRRVLVGRCFVGAYRVIPGKRRGDLREDLFLDPAGAKDWPLEEQHLQLPEEFRKKQKEFYGRRPEKPPFTLRCRGLLQKGAAK